MLQSRISSRVIALAMGTVLTLGVAGEAQASKLTNVIDTFDRTPGKDGVDFTITTSWDYWQRSGFVRREFRCLAHDEATRQFCLDASKIIDTKELKSERIWHQFNIDLELGFWRIAQLHMRLPIVLEDRTSLSFDEGVTPFNSSIDPDNRPSLFSVPFDGATRSGFYDPSFGVRFTPLSTPRDPTRPTWALGVDVTFPLGQVRKADNTGVGEGLWRIQVSSGVSARFQPWMEPYFRADGTFNLPAANSLFDDFGKTQTLVSPGHQLGITLGTEFIPYEDAEREQHFIVDLGGKIEFHFEGREYTEIFEALGNSACDPTDASEPCELTTFTRGDVDPTTGARRKSTGITDVEQYALLKAWFGFRWQMYKHIQFGAEAWIGHETTHFITTADAGTDLDGRNQVEAANSQGENEFNPVYSDAYDALGTRLRTGDVQLFGVSLSLQGKF